MTKKKRSAKTKNPINLASWEQEADKNDREALKEGDKYYEYWAELLKEKTRKKVEQTKKVVAGYWLCELTQKEFHKRTNEEDYFYRGITQHDLKRILEGQCLEPHGKFNEKNIEKHVNRKSNERSSSGLISVSRTWAGIRKFQKYGAIAIRKRTIITPQNPIEEWLVRYQGSDPNVIRLITDNAEVLIKKQLPLDAIILFPTNDDTNENPDTKESENMDKRKNKDKGHKRSAANKRRDRINGYEE
ncbi:hypothetical protein MADA3029_370003 [Vibrio nigripulchritudo MADA3029]|uniref:Uncharacterized protein n=1 Tax=Vibrio nigripulchritudo TaxID=28173 RepID=U4K1H5_9VIBR|nr:hypothetical protein [Vibrio nigripulchritudo]KJY75685.1 hypothetical protein TW74_17040 [Vibrio nigripulchritudo]CCN35143.1 hypothetical protein VIBNIAM115_1710002 [Vibrio nigripulchritudo AM115]CCN40975.1 hypothetical protein VIBNIFTn2_1420010 [Vibrio nigripulchritudo FTn2]CCN46457.1 hypothetical protein VIBNIMADA3020_1310003 [Vibrio nigripulchritudo MADA3020]CCN51512.1 hypothetical protein VIBNIMADA3021_1100003 [Vibrio nigripulchritudo MADA3021]